MYLLYEHHKDPVAGLILATDMLLTSFFPGSPRINFKSAEDKALFELCKLQFKSINAKERTIDMDTYVWSFFGDAGRKVYDMIKASPLAAAGIKFEAVKDLAGQRKAGFIARPSTLDVNPADFFYQQAAPAASGPSKDTIKQQLAAYLSISQVELETATIVNLKKPYRAAALRLHPDRNNGDAKGMTELNYYWQAWQPFAAQN